METKINNLFFGRLENKWKCKGKPDKKQVAIVLKNIENKLLNVHLQLVYDGKVCLCPPRKRKYEKF